MCPEGGQLILSVGGIEPRKGSDTLVRALAALRESGRDPVLAIVGDHSFQDYRAYVDRVLAMLPGVGLRLGRDVVRRDSVPDAELPAGTPRRTCSRSLRPRRAGGSRSWRP